MQEDSSAKSYGLDGKTTVKPVEKSGTISTTETWSKAPRNEGVVDIGYHYDPVDVVVGNATNNVLTVDYSQNTINFTIQPGVVVSFWRSYSSNTGQILCNRTNIIGPWASG